MTTVALVSDVHMRRELVDRLERELRALAAAMADCDPAHVFVLGDLIEDAGSAAVDRDHVESVAAAIEAAGAPVTYLLGNHDVARLDRETLAAALDQDAFHGVETVDGTPFVYLDSTAGCAEAPGGALGADQRAWLAETLPGLRDAVVLVHHPMGGFDLSTNPWFGDFPERAFLGDRLQAFQVIADAGGVAGTVSGHLHATQFSRFQAVPHVSVSAFSKERPDTPFTGTYALLEIGEPPEIEVRTIGERLATYVLQ